MRNILLYITINISVFSISQNTYDSDCKLIDSIKVELTNNGVTDLIVLNKWSAESYILWRTKDSCSIIKASQSNIFKHTQANNNIYFHKLISIFDYCTDNSPELFLEEVRPNNNDLIDSTTFEVYGNDTLYLIEAFECFGCPEVNLNIAINNNNKRFWWSSLYFERDSEFYYENLDSYFYHIYLMIESIIARNNELNLWNK